MRKVIIELQHFHGCPNAPILITSVKEAIKDLLNIKFMEVIIDSNEKAKQFKFRGSPTLLIDGKDFEDREEPNFPNLSCRVYQNGLPSVNEIRNRIINT
jgi:hypothetical protein